jgi:hypothetical protein
MDPQSAAVCLVAVLTGRLCYGERASHFVSRALNVRQNVEQLLKK